LEIFRLEIERSFFLGRWEPDQRGTDGDTANALLRGKNVVKGYDIGLREIGIARWRLLTG
jgi:hypothetical protein